MLHQSVHDVDWLKAAKAAFEQTTSPEQLVVSQAGALISIAESLEALVKLLREAPQAQLPLLHPMDKRPL